MTIAIGIVAVCLVAAVTLTLRNHPRTAKQFPPVVELAKTGLRPRLEFKIASLTARATTVPDGSASPAPNSPAPPAIPFLQTIPSPTGTDPIPSAAEAATRSPFASGPVQPRPPLRGDQLGPIPVSPVYKTRTGPYAAPLVHGSRISLPDDEGDLPIAFRSAHPNAKPIVEAGDTADQINIAGTDGRIHLNADGPVTFGPPAD